MKYRDGFKKGSLELLVLTILSDKDCYGYEISQLLKERSNHIISVPEGSLYPALYKLEENEYISKEKKLVGRRRERIYYHLEDSGRSALKEMEQAYQEISEGIASILNWEETDEQRSQTLS